MIKKTLILFLFFILAACGSSQPRYAGFDLDMPTALDDLNTDNMRVVGSVWSLDIDGQTPLEEVSFEEDTILTIRNHYALPVSSLVLTNQTYEFRLKVYYKAEAFEAEELTALKNQEEEAQETIEINSNVGLCPALNLSPDDSLMEVSSVSDPEHGGQWLELCSITYTDIFDETVLMEVSSSQINCEDFDADGDGVANLIEIDESIQPYEGDYDADCVADGIDAFPKDPDEWLDTDGDNLGDNEDMDADGDSISDEEELDLGTDFLDSDTDDDGMIDGNDNCPLNGSSADQTDTDLDSEGDICDEDSDSDGLSDDQELLIGTNPQDSDSDDDSLNDGEENQTGTSPLSSDSDADSFNDAQDIFPLDSTEWEDGDGDGIGNNSDLCPENAGADNTDTDGDQTGDSCDSDDDGDSVSDAVEEEVGSNPLSQDSDGDGLTDWFGGVQSSGSDACLLNATGDHSDGDGDGFGAVCDCNDTDSTINPAVEDIPDTSGLDSNCDGIDGDLDGAIYVHATTGNDSNDGTYGFPMATLEGAGETASQNGKDVYVAEGSFNLTDTFVVPDGIFFYGGYSSDFSVRDISIYLSQITTTESDLLMEVDSTGENTGFDGFTLSQEVVDSTATAILVMDAQFTLNNCTLQMGNISHGVGIEIFDSVIEIENNILDFFDMGDGNAPHTIYGIYLSNVTGSISSNQIQITDFDQQREAIYCSEEGNELIHFENNSIDILSSSESPKTGFDYLVGCDQTRYSSYDTSISDGEFEGFDISEALINLL